MFQRFWTMKTACLAIAVGVLAAPGCRASRPGEALEVGPELKLEGVQFRVYRGGDLRALGDAATVSLRRDSSDLWATGISVELPRPGEPVHIEAAAGEGNLSSREFTASGGITVSRGDDAARTDRARFEPADRGGLVRGDDPVVVEGRGYRLTGTGFVLDPATGVISVRGRARLVAGTGEAR
jgi:lipopolysaccharide export system protein LptC